MNQSTEEIKQTVDAVGLDMVQLHGKEGWGSDVTSFHAYGVPVIRVLHVATGMKSSGSNFETSTDIVEAISQQPLHAAAVLLDTKVAGASGGTGVKFDWSLVPPPSDSLPVFVAGGLNPENVADCVKQTKPYAVDVASGVEPSEKTTTDLPCKDAEKVCAFIRNAKSIKW